MTTRDNLLQAAKDLLWERGYEGMSPAAVQDRSGAGQGSFYHHFQGKMALAHNALAEVRDEMLQDFETLLEGSHTPAEAVRRYLELPRAGTQGCRMGRHAGERAIAEPGIREPVAAYFTHLEQRWQQRLAEAKAHGQLAEDVDSEALAATLVAVVQGGYVLARVHDDPEKMTRALQGAWSLFNKVLR